MNLFALFRGNLGLLHMQLTALDRVYLNNYPVARNIWYDAMRTQTDAANIGNHLLENNVDIPMALVIQLLNHTDIVLAYGPAFGF